MIDTHRKRKRADEAFKAAGLHAGEKMAKFSEQTQTPFHSGSGGTFKSLMKGLVMV